MRTFLRTTLVQNQAQGADGTLQFDLPVNPLTAILLTIRAEQIDEDVATSIAELLSMIPDVGVIFRGQDVIRGSLVDLAVLNAIVAGWSPYGSRPEDAAGDGCSITVPLCFGRVPYSGKEAFPASRRGDLVLELDVDVATTNFDTLALQVETVELLEERPSAFLKYSTSAVTFGSTGQEVVRLPIGNPLLGALLRGTTVPVGAARTATFEQLRVKVDNVEAGYARANWDTLHGEIARRLRGPHEFLEDHQHRGTYVTTVPANSTRIDKGNALLEHYGYLDYDPMMDGEFMIDTAGRADVVIQRDSGTADAGRVIPVELVRVAAAA